MDISRISRTIAAFIKSSVQSSSCVVDDIGDNLSSHADTRERLSRYRRDEMKRSKRKDAPAQSDSTALSQVPEMELRMRSANLEDANMRMGPQPSMAVLFRREPDCSDLALKTSVRDTARRGNLRPP